MSDNAPTAKVYVFKSTDVGEEGKPWHVATDQLGMVIITKSFDSYQDAWQWLEENYVREPVQTPEPYDGIMWGDDD